MESTPNINGNNRRSSLRSQLSEDQEFSQSPTQPHRTFENVIDSDMAHTKLDRGNSIQSGKSLPRSASASRRNQNEQKADVAFELLRATKTESDDEYTIRSPLLRSPSQPLQLIDNIWGQLKAEESATDSFQHSSPEPPSHVVRSVHQPTDWRGSQLHEQSLPPTDRREAMVTEKTLQNEIKRVLEPDVLNSSEGRDEYVEWTNICARQRAKDWYWGFPLLR